jgi:hypothetical protein
MLREFQVMRIHAALPGKDLINLKIITPPLISIYFSVTASINLGFNQVLDFFFTSGWGKVSGDS